MHFRVSRITPSHAVVFICILSNIDLHDTLLSTVLHTLCAVYNQTSAYLSCLGDAGDAEEEKEAVATQEVAHCPEAVVLRPAQSALPRIFCHVANAPSSTYPHQPQAAPTNPSADTVQLPPRCGKRLADSQPQTENTRLDTCSHAHASATEPAGESSSDQQPSASVHTGEARPHGSVERSVSPDIEAKPAVRLPIKPATLSIVTSGDSSQFALKREHSVNLVHLSGKPAQSDSAGSPLARQASLLAMHPESKDQASEYLQEEPAALSRGHVHQHHQQQLGELPGLGQAGSCNFDSLPPCLSAELLDLQAQYYTSFGPDAQQHPQQAAWAGTGSRPEPQTGSSDQSFVLPMSTMDMYPAASTASGSMSPRQRAGWGWSVTTGQERQSVQYGVEQDPGFSRRPMHGTLPPVSVTPQHDWEQQAWQDTWQLQQAQQQQQEQEASCMGPWAMPQGCGQWQPGTVPTASAAFHHEAPGTALPEYEESEGSWWMLPPPQCTG